MRGWGMQVGSEGWGRAGRLGAVGGDVMDAELGGCRGGWGM